MKSRDVGVSEKDWRVRVSRRGDVESEPD